MQLFLGYNPDSGQYEKYSSTIIIQRFNFRYKSMFVGHGRHEFFIF